MRALSIVVGCMALALVGWTTRAAASSPPWPSAPYSHYAENESLESVLDGYAGAFSLTLRMGRNVSGIVNGRFNSKTPTDFLDRLGGVYGFDWFVHAGTLYISRTTDATTRAISTRGNAPGDLQRALAQLGVLDSRFGWGALPERGVVLVGGPPAYVDLVEHTLSTLPGDAGGLQVAVFRLKHASVRDRTVTYRGESVVTPGVATILRNIIAGGGPGAGKPGARRDRPPVQIASPAAASTDAASGAPTAVISAAALGMPLGDELGIPIDPLAADPAAGALADLLRQPYAEAESSIMRQPPSVQADPRLNAIIVQDTHERLPIYRQLIEQLDVPSTLIEIQAMIVDVQESALGELGVSWSGKAGSASFGYNSSLTPQQATGTALVPGVLGLSVGDALTSRLKLMQERGDANILSQPSILTTDNMSALIDLSQTEYVKLEAERYASLGDITAGTSLRVTPRYVESGVNGRVELTVDIEDGRLLPGLMTADRANISTMAVIGNDETLLIAGYKHRRNEDGDSKVPLLGDLPVLGWLFSYKRHENRTRERLFLIRPRIVAINGRQVSPSTSVAQWGDVLNLTWSRGSTLMRWPATMMDLTLVKGQPTQVLQEPD